MFIRLKRVKLKSTVGASEEYSIHVVLVQSYRHKGKPRQRVIKYLGSIRESDLKQPPKQRQFISEMQGRIDRLDFNPLTLAKIKMNMIKRLIRARR